MNRLAPYATKTISEYARREEKEKLSLRQNPFKIDCYRIMSCPSFSKLTNKSQLWWDILDPHIRTRLTHTLSVSLIARTIARGLHLNEDLTEAIALGHDLGHTPFGHASEKAIQRVLGINFRHEEQSVRILKYIERTNPTIATLDGIAKHSTGKLGLNDPHTHLTNESKIVLFADKIDNDIHDFGDIQRLKISEWKKTPQEALATFGVTIDDLALNPQLTFEKMRAKIISSVIKASIISSNGQSIEIGMDKNIQAAQQELHEFISRLHDKEEYLAFRDTSALWVVRTLYKHYKDNPQTLIDTDLQQYLITKDMAEYSKYMAITSFDQQFIDAFCNMNDAIAITLCKKLSPTRANKYFPEDTSRISLPIPGGFNGVK